MKKEAKDKHFLNKPRYEGGPKALIKFIVDNLRYPKAAMENKVEGTVYINFEIDHHGKVTDAKTIAGIGHGCDEEAARLVKMLVFKVAKNRGLRVVFHKTLQVHFRLKETPAPTQFQVNYVAAPAKPATAAPAPPSIGYTISIEWE